MTDDALKIFFKGRKFVARANSLMEVDAETNNIKWQVETANTPIEKIVATQNPDQIVVYNYYYKFERPDGLSNIAAYSLEGAENWRCDIGDDIFSLLHFDLDGCGKLQGYSWFGGLYTIDETTGRILHSILVK